MEVESSQPDVAKKLWKIVRVVFFMIRKSLYRSKLMLDLHLMFERGNKLAGKAIGNLIEHHHASAFGCRSTDIVHSFVSTREYEFSCSNSPAYPNFHYFTKRRHRHHFPASYQYDDVSRFSAVHKVLEMLNNDKVEASPMVSLPGFGKSPAVRSLRITDSPFSIKDDGDSQVDMAAEEFIQKFYKDLKLQKRMAMFESPCRDVRSR